MAIRLGKEADILNPSFRKLIIEDIEGDENKDRKREHYKRYEVYKDLSKKYVLDTYKKEQGEETAKDVYHRVANLGICKAIIDKKAMIYTNGVRREAYLRDVQSEELQTQVDKIVDVLNLNTVMRKVNRWEELYKNVSIQVYPYLEEISNKWKIGLRVLAPYSYDVIGDANNPESPRVYITSYLTSADLNNSGVYTDFRSGDLQNQSIANAPIDQGIIDKNLVHKEYVWSSSHYYFTTDEKGEIIPGKQEDDLLNQIGQLSFINFSAEQDGSFWAVGGEDVIDGCILINVFLTDIYYIAKYQGMGTFYFFGSGVPKAMKVGPSQIVTLDLKEGDPTPQIGYATSNPPLEAYMSSIKEYIAMLLKTNRLQPASVIGLDNAITAASGIQELLQKSETIEAQEDKKEMYRDNEPRLFQIYAKWHNLLLERGLLSEELAEIGSIPEDLKVVLKFNEPKALSTEQEKLDIIDKRQQLNLDSQVDSIMRDNPELTRAQAEERLELILAEKVKEARARVMDYMEKNIMEENDTDKTDISDEEEEDGKQGDL